MPTRKVPGGYQWGTTGKVYKSKADADAQGAAVRASQNAKKSGKKKGK